MKLSNKALEPFGVKMEDIEAKDGIIETNGKKVVYWWNKYVWDNHEAYERWEQWCVEEIRKQYPVRDPRDLFERYAMIYAMPQPYLFRKSTYKQATLL